MNMARSVIFALVKRPYFVELFAIANLIVIALLTRGHDYIRPSFITVFLLAITLGTQALAGVAIRAVVALVRKRRGYLRRLKRAGWWLETARLVLAVSLTFFTYGWIKLAMPVVHPRLFDQELWDLDQLLLFGAAPTVFVLDVFGNDLFLKTIDWSYANIFMASTAVAAAYFLSDPSRRVRIAFVNGNATLWLVGAWLYMLVPSLGPAYRFPDVWLAYGETLPRTQWLQGTLMRNYQNVLRAIRGEPHAPLNIMFGIAAFPSLHVAFQTYVFLWMRKLWTSGEVLFGIFAAAIFLGSMITGWHYLIDGLAGLVLAYVCWWVFWRRARMTRFLRLFR
jgi:hypothetical protein